MNVVGKHRLSARFMCPEYKKLTKNALTAPNSPTRHEHATGKFSKLLKRQF
jgi:hypothetical protein